jgi:hypothetical protein
MTAHTLFVCNGGSVIFILPIERTEITVLDRPSPRSWSRPASRRQARLLNRDPPRGQPMVDHTVKRAVWGAHFLEYYCLTGGVARLSSVGHSNRAAPAAVAALSRRRESRSAQADEA